MDSKENRTAPNRSGLTFVELLVVLFILAALAGIIVPLLSGARDDSAEQATEASLVAVRDAVIRQWTDTKYVNLPGTPTSVATESQRFHLRWLFESPVSGTAASDFDPDTRIGWNGPYVAQFTGRYEIDNSSNFTSVYGSANDPAVLDAFTGRPVVIQVVGAASPYDVRVVSAGLDGELDIDPSNATADLEPEGGLVPVDDDIYISFVLR